jgi:thioredoxin 1
MKTTLAALALCLLLGAATAAPLPYDDKANAHADVQQAVQAAQAAKRPVLVIFGANWCEDCRALDASLKTPKTAELMAKNFVVVKVDVGRFDRNLDLASRYGDPIKKGIPAASIVSPEGQVLYTTRAGELSSARRMSDTGVYDFFSHAAASAGKPKP